MGHAIALLRRGWRPVLCAEDVSALSLCTEQVDFDRAKLGPVRKMHVLFDFLTRVETVDPVLDTPPRRSVSLMGPSNEFIV